MFWCFFFFLFLQFLLFFFHDLFLTHTLLACGLWMGGDRLLSVLRELLFRGSRCQLCVLQGPYSNLQPLISVVQPVLLSIVRSSYDQFPTSETCCMHMPFLLFNKPYIILVLYTTRHVTSYVFQSPISVPYPVSDLPLFCNGSLPFALSNTKSPVPSIQPPMSISRCPMHPMYTLESPICDLNIAHLTSSLCDVLTPQVIPDKSTKHISVFRCLRWSAHFFHQFFQNAGQRHARVGALAWVRGRVGVRVGRRPLAI